MLGWYRAAILLTSFRRATAKLQHHPLLVPPQELPISQREEAKTIGYLVAAAARYTPWQSLCLVQVLVTQRLLAKRNIPGQFYLGVRPGCERSDDPTGLAAHAWLQCGERIINGATPQRAYVVLSTYTWGQSAWE